MLSMLQKLFGGRNEEGASAVEYGLLVAAIAAVIAIVVFALGGNILSAFTDTCEAVSANVSAPADCN